MLGKIPVEIEQTTNAIQNFTSLHLYIPTAQRDTPIGFRHHEAKTGHMLEQAKQLLSIPVDGNLHGSTFRGQRWPRQVLTRLEDLVCETDELRSVLCAHKVTSCDVRLAVVCLLVAIPGEGPASG